LANPILPKPSKRGDIVTVQIDIEDINNTASSFIRTMPIQGYTEKPFIYEIRAYQRNDGSGMVNIDYVYEGLGEINNAYVYAQFSNTNGVTWSEIPTNSLKGDFGYNVIPGCRRITWNPTIDMNVAEILEPLLCRLTLYDSDAKLAEGYSISGPIVIDNDKPEVAIIRS
jgi:hypothetical protein